MFVCVFSACTIVTNAINAHREVRCVESRVGAGIHVGRQFIVLDFLAFAATRAHEVSIAHIADSLILHLHTIKKQLAQDTRLDEQFHGVVDCSPTHVVSIILQLTVELLYGECVRQGQNLVKNSKAFRGFAKSPFFKVMCEFLDYRVIAKLFSHLLCCGVTKLAPFHKYLKFLWHYF